jgi:hypothetical protein
MADIDDLQNLTGKLCEYFYLSGGTLSNTMTHIFDLASKSEVCRLELLPVRGTGPEKDVEIHTICLSFQIEVLSNDAIVMFSKAREFGGEIGLLNGYYLAKDGTIYRGFEAYTMSENDKEASARSRVMQEIKIQQIEQWEIEKLERSSKMRIH